MSISPERLRETSERHPLFRSLSGQVLWLLFEERNAPQETIDAFMEYAIAWREEQVSVLAQLEDDPSLYLQVSVESPQISCQQCRMLNGAVLPANHPELMEYLPPYAIGCRCKAKAMKKDALSPTTPQLTQFPKPKRVLHCESEWFFTADWTTRK